jgi:hypothetical protein
MKKALTLTLSRPTGEGTACGRFSHSQRSTFKHAEFNFSKGVKRFPLSYRMGEGRGEGALF